MSEESIMHWKRESCGNQLAGTASANTSSGYFVKTEGVAGESSSSLSLSGPPSIVATSNLPSEIFAQHQQQLELQKISNSITKMNSLPKLSGLDGIQQMPEEERLCRIQQIVEAGIGDHAKQTILQILDKVSLLKPPERLLLYLRMPGGTPETDPLRQPQNPLGTRSEINHTINWVRSHLEHDPKVSIPKQDVYNDYVAYCDRVDIKPLSTADFGKVMKQVFPEIRPRRLGTRGHSRYCYAAMRKATKLDPPKLPDLGANSNLPDFNATMDEDSWKIIKMWAEGLLNSSFDNTKDLATHITKHHLNSPASNSSRLLLQKKLLQRDAKEKRKYGDNSPMKKRRKKKRKSSSSSESTQQMNSMSMESNTGNQALLDVKKEADASTPTQHLLQQQKLGPVQPSVAQLQQQQKQKNLPINLVTEHDNNMRKIQGTNLACDNNLVAGCTAKNLVAQSLPPMCGPPSMIDDPTAVAAAAATTAAIATGTSSGTGVVLTSAANVTAASSSSGMPQNLIKPTLSVIKEELPDDYHSNILCKKVRQAQQSKRLWNPSSTSHNPNVDQTTMMSMSESAHNLPSYPAVGDSLMAPPPTQMDIHMENVGGFKRAPGHHGIHGHPHVGHRSSPVTMPLRAKKLRYIHAKLEAMQQQRNEGNDNNGEKDVLPENLGIPRERVISICNMDKHELDDYLNEEDNSQDQEAELLQYFQSEAAEGKGGHDQASSAQMENSTNPNNYSSMGENYQQYYGGGKFERKTGPQHDQDEINQLRYYLHQNLQTNKSHDAPGMGKTSMEGSGESYTGMYPGGSASASLAMMSQRHLSVLPEDPINLRCCNEAGGQIINNAGQNSALRGPRRKINLNARSCVPNSPNTRRKNFSFVPISPTTNNNNNNNSIDFSPFVSPRSTPVVRKPPLHKQQSLPLSDQNITDPMMAATSGPDFGKSLNFQNALSASAPPSPSLVQQRFRYAPTTIASMNAGGMSAGNASMANGNEQYNHFQSVAVQCRAQNSNSLDGMTESRSQSVPLHCRNSPGFGHSSNYPGFSSQCSSVAQTPVPPEFADFSDASILDIFADTTQQNQPVKLETNDMIVAGTASTSILDSDISTEIGMADFLAHELNTTKGNNPLTSISRSVPSTPLPLIGNFKSNVGNSATSNSHGQHQQDTAGKLNKMYDISKSVPTTPVAMSVAPFRYSPEFNRDFLINGNTIETGKMSAFYNQQQPQQQSDQQQQAQSAQQVQQQQQQQAQQSQHGSIDAGNDSVAGKVITTSLTEEIFFWTYETKFS